MEEISRANLKNITILLVEPQIPENIGAVARAMCNMGFERLCLVRPKDCDLSRILKMAKGPAIDIVEEMEVYDELLDAIGPYEYVVGTTARIGSRRPAMLNARELAKEVIGISQNNRIVIMFGREDRGLSNDELRYCHTIVRIPTSTFSSLNLAHAVLIICYEIFMESADLKPPFIGRLANRFELEAMFEHLKETLMKIGFINPQNPEHFMLNIRRMIHRYPVRAKDVQIIRGICRQIDWYVDKNKKS